MSRRIRLVAVIGVVAAVALAMASPAGAYRTDWFESLSGDQRSQLRELVRWMGPYKAVPPVNEAPAGYDAAHRAWQSMQAMKPSAAPTPAKQTAWQRAQTMLYRAASKAKVLATPKVAGVYKNLFALSARTPYVFAAWSIGSYVNRKFFRIGVNTGPDLGPVTAFAFIPRDEGDQIYWGDDPQHMPFDGFQVWWERQGYNGWIDQWTSLTPNCDEPGNPIPTGPPFAPFAGQVDVGPIQSPAFCGYTPPEEIHARGETRMVAIPPYVIDPPQPYVPSEHDPLTNGPMPTVPDPSDQTIDEALEDLLERPESDDLRAWVDHQLQPEQAEYDPYPALEQTVQVLEGPSTEERRRTAEETVNDCGVPIWHYTSVAKASNIYAERQINVEDEGYVFSPPGAYASTLTPVDPTYPTQVGLSYHLFTKRKDVGGWVLLCSTHNPSFRPVGPPAPADFFYSPQAPENSVTVQPEAWGTTPKPLE